MDQYELEVFLEERFDQIRSVLAHKGSEYVPEDDLNRFHNFNTAAAFNNETPERALWGMLTKHLVSLSDMVQEESVNYPAYVWDEKLGDAVNYLLLLWAMTQHHRDVYENIVEYPPVHHIHMNDSWESNLNPIGVEFYD